MGKKLTFSSSIIAHIHKLSRSFIDRYYKDETVFFDNIWEIYEPELKKWISKHPEKWHFKVKKSRLLGALGFTDPTQIPDLITPKIIDVISKIERNIMWRLMYSKFIPKIRDIEMIMEKSMDSFELPSDVENNLKSFLFPMCLKDISKISEALKREEIRIEIIKRGKPIEFSKEEVRELKSKKEEFDIWIYKTYRSDEKEEILIDKSPAHIRDQSLKLLICLLKRTGRLCGYPEIFSEVWHEEKKFSKSYQRGKIVQAIRELRKFKIFADNIHPERGMGYKMEEGGRNHCIIYSTQLFLIE